MCIKHCYIKEVKDNHFQILKNNLVDGQILLRFDFAANNASAIQNEIQAAYWSNVQATLFTVIAPFPASDDQSYVPDIFNKMKHSFWLYTNILTRHQKEK